MPELSKKRIKERKIRFNMITDNWGGISKFFKIQSFYPFLMLDNRIFRCLALKLDSYITPSSTHFPEKIFFRCPNHFQSNLSPPIFILFQKVRTAKKYR